MICLHWLGGDATTWRPWARALDPARVRTIALDFRGHGGGNPAAVPLTTARLAEDAIELADALGLDRFAIAGLSFGGKVALQVAALAPSRVAGLLLFGALGPGLVPLDRAMVEPLLQRAADLAFVRECFRPWFKVWPNEELDRYLQGFSRTPAWALRAVCEAALWSDLSAEIPRLALPALVVAGGCDPVYGPDYQCSAVLPFVPAARMVTLDCGHGLVLELPGETAALSAEFLATLR